MIPLALDSGCGEDFTNAKLPVQQLMFFGVQLDTAPQLGLTHPAAVNFCSAFNVNLHWLVFGETMVDSDTAANLVAAKFQAVEDEAIRCDVRLTAAKASKIGRYLFALCLSKETLPVDEVKEIFGLIE